MHRHTWGLMLLSTKQMKGDRNSWCLDARWLQSAFGIGLYLCWAFALRYSGVFYRPFETTLPSYVFTTATVLAFFIGCLVSKRLLFCLQHASFRNALLIGAGLTAFVAVLFSELSSISGSYPILLPAICGIVAGSSLFVASVLALQAFMLVALRQALKTLFVALAIGSTVFVFASTILPESIAVPIYAAVPVCAALLLGGPIGRCHKPSGFNKSQDNEFFVAANERLDFWCLAFVFLTSFLMVYAVGLLPNTTHLINMEIAGQYIGTTSVYSLLSLLLLCLFTALFTYVVDKRSYFILVVLVLIVVFAVVFYLLPLGRDSKVPSMAISALTPCMLITAFALESNRTVTQGDASVKRLGKLYIALGSGALFAATLSSAFVGPLWEVFTGYNILVTVTMMLPILLLVLTLSQLSGRFKLLLFGQQASVPILDTDIAAQTLEAIAERYALTSRELEVLELLAEGRNQPYIESKLTISRATVKTHIVHIYRKLGINSKQELISLLRG
jgi:DNA-binding CsgD family transcriptional regulator